MCTACCTSLSIFFLLFQCSLLLSMMMMPKPDISCRDWWETLRSAFDDGLLLLLTSLPQLDTPLRPCLINQPNRLRCLLVSRRAIMEKGQEVRLIIWNPDQFRRIYVQIGRLSNCSKKVTLFFNWLMFLISKNVFPSKFRLYDSDHHISSSVTDIDDLRI